MNIRDEVNRVRERTYTNIPDQFPSVYRENAELFVEFTKSYYEHVDTQSHSFRDAFIIRDVDTTYEEFIIYFKNKYLHDLPYQNEDDIRFIIKHITELYRRKGTEESLRLLFRLFFEEDIEVFYPSSAILKLSDSKYGSDNYLEMKQVNSVKNYPISRGEKIRGDTSKAEGFVDEIIFKVFSGVITPILYISNMRGRFISDDGLYKVASGETIGKLVAGSVTTAEIIKSGLREPANEVGDILELRSSKTGLRATAIVNETAAKSTGIIDFQVIDGGYGYTLDETLIDKYVSDQVIVLSSEESVQDLLELDTISDDLTTASARVVKYAHPLLFINVIGDAFPLWENQPSNYVITNDRTSTTFEAIRIAARNGSADCDIGLLKDTEQVTIIPDIIGNFESVQLDSTDYGMSGAGAETLATALQDAFTPLTLTIGEIDKLLILNNGVAYENDVRTLMIQPEIANFNKKDVGIVFNRQDFFLQKGDFITQERQVENFITGTQFAYTVRAQFLRREGDIYYFRRKSFYDFDDDLPVVLKSNEYAISNILVDESSRPLGNNADIRGEAEFARGQIESIKITDSGYRYRDGEEVEVVSVSATRTDGSVNLNKDMVVATAIVSAQGTGFTEGRWKTTSSFLNEASKVIRDNHYYQEYSYDVSSIVNPDKYESFVTEHVGVAGTKLFSSPLINSLNSFDEDIDMSVEIYRLDEELGVSNNSIIIDTLGISNNSIIIGDLVATLAVLEETVVPLDNE